MESTYVKTAWEGRPVNVGLWGIKCAGSHQGVWDCLLSLYSHTCPGDCLLMLASCPADRYPGSVGEESKLSVYYVCVLFICVFVFCLYVCYVHEAFSGPG